MLSIEPDSADITARQNYIKPYPSRGTQVSAPFPPLEKNEKTSILFFYIFLLFVEHVIKCFI